MKSLSIIAAVLAAGLSGPAMADFTGIAAPANFTVVNIGTMIGGVPSSGAVSAFNATLLAMSGSDTAAAGCDGGGYGVLSSPCQLQVTTNRSARFSFDWSYVTADLDGPPGDIFGVLIDGARSALSDPGGANAQSGHYTSPSASVFSFGWFVNCTDCTGGAATARVSNFALIPEPSSGALLLAGAIGLGASRRRSRAARG